MANIKSELSAFKKNFDKAFFTYLDNRLKSISDPKFRQYLETQNNYFKKGGKRLRPYLTSIFYQGFANKKTNLKFLIPLELFHQFLLIHDDIIDQSLLRYGGPNLWATYKNLGEKYKVNSSHFGLSLSLIAGDLTYSEAIELVNNFSIPAKNRQNLISLITDTAIKTSQGWYLQYLDTSDSLKNASKKKFIDSNLLVTSYYSFFSPVKYAAILAGKNISDQKILAFSNPLGLAYQIHDDYLGIFGKEKTLGKPIASDIEEGKKTLFVLKTFKLASLKQKKFLETHLGKKINPKDFDKIKKIIKNSTSVDYCLSYEQKLLKKSLKELEKLTNDKALFSQITELIHFLLKRKY